MTPDNPLPFEIGFSRSPAGRRREPDAPFRLLLCGDFSGSSTVRPADLAQRKAQRAMMMEMQPEMMAHMGRHMGMKMHGGEGGMDCPMMKSDAAPMAMEKKPKT